MLQGLCKALLEMDDEARASGAPRVVDADFIEAHTRGFDALEQQLRALDWADIALESGLGEAQIR